MRSSIPGWERKNLSHETKSCVVYSQHGTVQGPVRVFCVIQSCAPHGLLRLVSLKIHICGISCSVYSLKHLGQHMERMIFGSIESVDMAVRISQGREKWQVGWLLCTVVVDDRRALILMPIMTRMSIALRMVPAADLLRWCRRCSQITMLQAKRNKARRRRLGSEVKSEYLVQHK